MRRHSDRAIPARADPGRGGPDVHRAGLRGRVPPGRSPRRWGEAILWYYHFASKQDILAALLAGTVKPSLTFAGKLARGGEPRTSSSTRSPTSTCAAVQRALEHRCALRPAGAARRAVRDVPPGPPACSKAPTGAGSLTACRRAVQGRVQCGRERAGVHARRKRDHHALDGMRIHPALADTIGARLPEAARVCRRGRGERRDRMQAAAALAPELLPAV